MGVGVSQTSTACSRQCVNVLPSSCQQGIHLTLLRRAHFPNSFPTAFLTFLNPEVGLLFYYSLINSCMLSCCSRVTSTINELWIRTLVGQLHTVPVVQTHYQHTYLPNSGWMFSVQQSKSNQTSSSWWLGSL